MAQRAECDSSICVAVFKTQKVFDAAEKKGWRSETTTGKRIRHRDYYIKQDVMFLCFNERDTDGGKVEPSNSTKQTQMSSTVAKR